MTDPALRAALKAKDQQLAQLRGKLGQVTRMRDDGRKFYAKDAEDHRAMQMTRNRLAWLVLNAIAVMNQYRDPVTVLARAGLQAKLDQVMPDFRAKVQADEDRRAEGNEKADAAERARRAKGDDDD